MFVLFIILKYDYFVFHFKTQVDLIVPTKVQGVILHGWYQMKIMFIHSFVVEFGLQEYNLKQYGEDGLNLKVINLTLLRLSFSKNDIKLLVSLSCH